MIGTSTKMNSILWADDLDVISKSKEDLTNMLEDLVKFSSKNMLNVNRIKLNVGLQQNRQTM